jgi:hypothetical protein
VGRVDLEVSEELAVQGDDPHVAGSQWRRIDIPLKLRPTPVCRNFES